MGTSVTVVLPVMLQHQRAKWCQLFFHVSKCGPNAVTALTAGAVLVRQSCWKAPSQGSTVLPLDQAPNGGTALGVSPGMAALPSPRAAQGNWGSLWCC